MSLLQRHGPLLGCLFLGAAVLLIPLKPAAKPIPTPLPVPRPASSLPSSHAESRLPLGPNATLHLGLSQSVLAAGAVQPLQVAVEVTGQGSMGRSSRALVLCMDRSGSMNAGNNMQKAV